MQFGFFTFNPIYQERVWGGRGLAEHLGRELPGEAPIGESWEIVDREEAVSVVADGAYAGRTLRSLLEAHATAIMGPGSNPKAPFPILVKWLDCKERLSLQVHPPTDVAPELGGEPKTENWYVVHAADGAALLCGLSEGVSKEQFRQAIDDEALEPLVRRLPTKAGDSLFVPSGRLHAIDGGNLILEIQQNSDTTYRVYDWGRVGLDGKPRQLHIEESMASIDFSDTEPELLHREGNRQTLADSPLFRLTRVSLDPGEQLAYAGGVEPRLLSVTSGALKEETSDRTLDRGQQALLPFVDDFTFTATEPTEVIITDHFARAGATSS